MIVTFIVVVVTLLMAGFVIARFTVPGAREWFEAPKHRFMENESRFTPSPPLGVGSEEGRSD